MDWSKSFRIPIGGEEGVGRKNMMFEVERSRCRRCAWR